MKSPSPPRRRAPARRKHYALYLTKMVAYLPMACCLLGTKCIEYVPAPEPPSDAGGTPRMDGAATPDADTPPVSFKPAIPCPSTGEARFVVRNYQYAIACGCAESEGRTCTIPPGTRVIWHFADGVAHNVTHEAISSADRRTGIFEQEFREPGEYGYGCTLHPRTMSGYEIKVQP